MVRDKQPITVIDDDPDSQRILRHILEGAGYQVRGILDSQAALDDLRRETPALIILDLKMEPLDGWTPRRISRRHSTNAWISAWFAR